MAEIVGGSMPRGFDEKRAELRREVEQKHPNWSEERKRRYIYGTLRKLYPNWEPNE